MMSIDLMPTCRLPYHAAPGMDILCSDKTGTLTLNKLSIDLAAAFPMTGEAGVAVSNPIGFCSCEQHE